MSGTIRTTCPVCGASNRMEVSFPAHNRGFDTKEYDCPVCGEHLTVADLHKYNEDGTIKEATQSGENEGSKEHEASKQSHYQEAADRRRRPGVLEHTRNPA